MKALALASLAWLATCIAPAHASDPDATLLAALDREARAPADYLSRKFETADVVLLGEDHAIAQTLDFVRALLPDLYARGVRNLVMEFGAEEDQAELDRLLAAPTYDEAAARRLMFHYNVAWSWREYRELYRAAWRFNRSLPAGRPPLRIVNMSYVYRWGEFRAPRTPETMRRVFWRGTVDAFRAGVIEREVLRRGEKALVLTGTPHAFTRYATPRLDDNREGFCAFDDNWLGNRLLRAHPDRIASVVVHQPFANRIGEKPTYVQPAQGAIERLMARRGNAPRGFDLRGSALGGLADRSGYSTCHDDFKLADLFDGYLFLAPIRQLRPAGVDADFIDADNLGTALANFPDPDWKAPPRDLAGAREYLAGMAEEIRRRYQSVE